MYYLFCYVGELDHKRVEIFLSISFPNEVINKRFFVSNIPVLISFMFREMFVCYSINDSHIETVKTIFFFFFVIFNHEDSVLPLSGYFYTIVSLLVNWNNPKDLLSCA